MILTASIATHGQASCAAVSAVVDSSGSISRAAHGPSWLMSREHHHPAGALAVPHMVESPALSGMVVFPDGAEHGSVLDVVLSELLNHPETESVGQVVGVDISF